jgi:hypothetical protein
MKVRKKEQIVKLVTDEDGNVREFKFDLVNYIPRNVGLSICSIACSYNEWCHKFPDPEHMGDRGLNFEDFCCALDESDRWIPVPAKGSIEEAGLKEET